MVALYRELGTYAAVAKKLKRSPDTVSKYVQQYEIAVMTRQYMLQQGLITKADKVVGLYGFTFDD